MVRRDAQTTVLVYARAHEIPILRQMFGRDNVTDETPVGVVEIDVDEEAQRLADKYGEKKIADIFGDDGGTRLRKEIESAAVKGEPARRLPSAKTAA